MSTPNPTEDQQDHDQVSENTAINPQYGASDQDSDSETGSVFHIALLFQTDPEQLDPEEASREAEITQEGEADPIHSIDLCSTDVGNPLDETSTQDLVDKSQRSSEKDIRSGGSERMSDDSPKPEAEIDTLEGDETWSQADLDVDPLQSERAEESNPVTQMSEATPAQSSVSPIHSSLPSALALPVVDAYTSPSRRTTRVRDEVDEMFDMAQREYEDAMTFFNTDGEQGRYPPPAMAAELRIPVGSVAPHVAYEAMYGRPAPNFRFGGDRRCVVTENVLRPYSADDL